VALVGLLHLLHCRWRVHDGVDRVHVVERDAFNGEAVDDAEAA
jgi:hypothetical protein